MCLIGIRWEPEAETPFLLVANRDELYDRPTREGHFWDENPDVYGGKDLLAGGSWMGVSKQGRFAAVTNFREMPVVEGKRSRGALVHDFLCSDISAIEYLSGISEYADEWSGFNLLLADGNGLFYYSNRKNEIEQLKSGIYVLTNHLLNSPWPKSEKLKKCLSGSNYGDHSNDYWFEVMRDTRQAHLSQLPDTGVGVEREKLLSSLFIESENYGTRTTTLIKMNKIDSLLWIEKNYSVNSESEKRHKNIGLKKLIL